MKIEGLLKNAPPTKKQTTIEKSTNNFWMMIKWLKKLTENNKNLVAYALDGPIKYCSIDWLFSIDICFDVEVEAIFYAFPALSRKDFKSTHFFIFKLYDLHFRKMHDSFTNYGSKQH